MLEICVASVDAAVMAVQAGAQRIELNSALPLGGLTPSFAAMKLCRQLCDVPIIAMVRPREGDFLYSEREFEQMMLNASHLLAMGANGLAFGFLQADNRIDETRVRRMVGLAGDRETVFHRAFDLLDDQLMAMRLLQSTGVTRILSSGGAASAWDGRETLKQLIDDPGRSIEILPGGGVNPDNAGSLTAYLGQKHLHASCSARITSPLNWNASIAFHDSSLRQNMHLSVDEEKVRLLAKQS